MTVVSDALTATGKRVIVAIPPTLAGRIDYDPPLPPLRDQLTQHMPQGTLMKFEAIYDTPFWRDKGLTGPGRERERPGQGHLRHSPPDGSPGHHDGLHRRPRGARLGGPAARASAAPPRCRTSPTTSATEALNPREVVEFNWSTEVWNRGCPVAVLGARHADRLRHRAARAGRAASTGPAPRPRPTGTATWTAPCAPASARRKRCSRGCRPCVSRVLDRAVRAIFV